MLHRRRFLQMGSLGAGTFFSRSAPARNGRELSRVNRRFRVGRGQVMMNVLAKELDAFLVSTDEGVVSWGREFGVKEMEASLFGQKLLG